MRKYANLSLETIKVLVRDFCPMSSSKWQHGTITTVCGELIYEVDCEGHQRQVHIDHLLPAPLPTTPMSQDTTVLNAEHEAVRNQEGLLTLMFHHHHQKIIQHHLIYIVTPYHYHITFQYHLHHVGPYMSATNQDA